MIKSPGREPGAAADDKRDLRAWKAKTSQN